MSQYSKTFPFLVDAIKSSIDAVQKTLKLFVSVIEGYATEATTIFFVKHDLKESFEVLGVEICTHHPPQTVTDRGPRSSENVTDRDRHSV
jgi:ABC-type Mn2+/Zn2+ transport system ATPase subunit